MARLRANAEIGVTSMSGNSDGGSVFDFSQPAGWTMLFWILSIGFLLFLYFSL